MTTEELYAVIIFILGVLILFQVFFMYLMKVRMRQLQFEIEQGSSRVDLSDIELEALTRNVEAFKRLKI
jgi:heme/copper-type cytochrome/quinol oxidase subunit 3